MATHGPEQPGEKSLVANWARGPNIDRLAALWTTFL
jgi:hypothetical protein